MFGKFKNKSQKLVKENNTIKIEKNCKECCSCCCCQLKMKNCQICQNQMISTKKSPFLTFINASHGRN